MYECMSVCHLLYYKHTRDSISYKQLQFLLDIQFTVPEMAKIRLALLLVVWHNLFDI